MFNKLTQLKSIQFSKWLFHRKNYF